MCHTFWLYNLHSLGQFFITHDEGILLDIKLVEIGNFFFEPNLHTEQIQIEEKILIVNLVRYQVHNHENGSNTRYA